MRSTSMALDNPDEPSPRPMRAFHVTRHLGHHLTTHGVCVSSRGLLIEVPFLHQQRELIVIDSPLFRHDN